MINSSELLRRENRDWDKIYSVYSLAEIPWHSDLPDKELVELLKRIEIKPHQVLDVGCGSGTDAIYFASKGYQVTALDVSSEAIRLAEERAKKAKVKIKFLVCDFLESNYNQESFDFINDRGCFHHILPADRKLFASKINQVLKLGGYYYLRCWSDQQEEREQGPYRISKAEIRETFSQYFELGLIQDFRFGGKGAKGYACLMCKV